MPRPLETGSALASQGTAAMPWQLICMVKIAYSCDLARTVFPSLSLGVQFKEAERWDRRLAFFLYLTSPASQVSFVWSGFSHVFPLPQGWKWGSEGASWRGGRAVSPYGNRGQRREKQGKDRQLWVDISFSF